MSLVLDVRYLSRQTGDFAAEVVEFPETVGTLDMNAMIRDDSVQ